MTRSTTIVHRFTELATATLLTPVVASDDDRVSTAFDTMFDAVNRWPTLTAFEEAVGRMRARADASPQTESLLIGVYAIDEFGALAGGRFEQAAVAQVVRLALGHQDFAGHDLFVAYEEPGRLWVALGGGPIIRNGIALLRGLQQHINDHGAVPSARLDVDVHVSVSFGYAAHQVDDFTFDGLLATARNRLVTDQASRDPFYVDSLLSYDIRPEDIIGEPEAPVTAVDVLNLLRADHASPTGGPFVTSFRPDHATSTPTRRWRSSWRRAGSARSATSTSASPTRSGRWSTARRSWPRSRRGSCSSGCRTVFAEADALGHADLPILIALPSILLDPDAGELALPNLLTPFLDRRECARTVVLVDSVPLGGGQALRLLSDRGVQIAVTAAAAAAADPTDLFGWQRWAVFFPTHVVQGPAGVDGLTIQQTASAIATHDTRLIARGRRPGRLPAARPPQRPLGRRPGPCGGVGARVGRRPVDPRSIATRSRSPAHRGEPAEPLRDAVPRALRLLAMASQPFPAGSCGLAPQQPTDDCSSFGTSTPRVGPGASLM